MVYFKLIQGDIVGAEADVLVCSANPWLRLTGGVGASLREAAGEGVEQELQAALQAREAQWLEPGTIIQTGPVLAFQAVLHAVAIDGRYHSHQFLLRDVLEGVFRRCRDSKWRTLALPALATGYGNYPMVDFLLLLESMLPDSGLEEIHLYLSRPEHVELAQIIFATGMPEKPIQPAPPAWRLLLMVEVLHSWGYERLRVLPRPAPSGVYWRCGFLDSSNLNGEGTGPLSQGGLWQEYSSSTGDLYFDWGDSTCLNSAHLAARFLKAFPDLASASRGPDPEYVRWYREQLLRCCGPENLPFYAFDEMEDLVGLQNQRGQTIPLPPRNQQAQR
ncbi:macro domain-containing protein [bacterium]|nr:macro domain-containing protein [bacterium]